MPIYALGGSTPKLPPAGLHWIAPDAHLIGQVELGENVGIWFGAVLRGDNEKIAIGDGTNIQEGVMAHTDMGFPLTTGKGCTIGHHAILHGCTLGDNVLVGMGATILNGAKIGNNCLVGANALVTEGKEFPDNSLIVGAPARVVRVLDEKAIESIRCSAENYVKNWQRFARDLKQIG
ncbi:carbonic anhydrase/acetyltransferase family protein [Rhizobium phaseoli]|uniref:gamma carbonic anhydrase family protein n=1 Tax=Rhizobium phaseoli TaxID=396 RepID=UPI0007EBC2F1|nr:gamma carbonic anhydrase family protein [Rhizobium phaseoli]ANL47424.1 carbonic anhydrase/acetyltransferase family protein [Rhizobium phaseoli]PDS32373.1 gamma carbonic anhydrase family protein [Rhizobium phaseoli]